MTEPGVETEGTLETDVNVGADGDVNGTLEDCPVELVTRDDKVVLWVDTGERLVDVEIGMEGAYALSDEFVNKADQVAVNIGVVGDD